MLRRIQSLEKSESLAIVNTFKGLFNNQGHIIAGMDVGKHSDTQLSISSGSVVTNKLDVIENDVTELVDINDIMSERRLSSIPDGTHSLLVNADPDIPRFLLLIQKSPGEYDNAPTNYTFLKNIVVSGNKITDLYDGYNPIVNEKVTQLAFFSEKGTKGSDTYRVLKKIDTQVLSNVNGDFTVTFDGLSDDSCNEYVICVNGKYDFQNGNPNGYFYVYINDDNDDSHYVNNCLPGDIIAPPQYERLKIEFPVKTDDLTYNFVGEININTLYEKYHSFNATFFSLRTAGPDGGSGVTDHKIYRTVSEDLVKINIEGHDYINGEFEFVLYQYVDTDSIVSPPSVDDPQVITSNTTLTACGIYLVDTNSGAIDITLPQVTALNNCKLYIKNIGDNPVNVYVQGTDTIDGNSSYTLTTKNEAIDLVNDHDTTTWYIL